MPTVRTRWLSGNESACHCRRRWFDPWVGMIPWRRKWQPAPVFLPGKSNGQRSPAGYSHKESAPTEHTQMGRRAPTLAKGCQLLPKCNLLTELVLKRGKTDWFVLQSLFFPKSLCRVCIWKGNQLYPAWEKEREQRQGSPIHWRKCQLGSKLSMFQE